MKKKSKHSSEHFFSRYDARQDLGYGRVSQKFHKPRQMPKQYPYSRDEDDEASEWHDHETQQAIGKKTLNFYKTDPFAIKGSNPFYFAAGNTKLSDCFYRIDRVLEEVHALKNSMSPIPTPKKNRARSGLGASINSKSLSHNSYKRTGSRKGFSSSPPDLKYDKNVNDDLDSIFNLDDLAKRQEHESGNFKL